MIDTIKLSEMNEAEEINEEDLLMIVQNGVNKKIKAKKIGKGEGSVTGDTVPIGAIIEWFSETIPENWLLCNGQSVNIADYPELYDVIGTTYGARNTTTFKVPNYEGRSPIGVDKSDTDFEILGTKGGEKKHKLTVNEIPYYFDGQRNSDTGTDWTKQGITEKEPIEISLMQPYITTYFIIKAKQNAGLVATVLDNLESDSTTDALSAKQGKVLNEKINNINTYSTEEINTGKTWIDGKTIYRKVLNIPNVTSTGSLTASKVSLTNTNYETVTDIKAIAKLTSNDIIAIPYVYQSNFLTIALNSTKELYVYSTGYSTSKITAVIEYTKED